MATIVTYDIPSKHRELKERMFNLGYKDSFPEANRKMVYLPNTTLYHQSKTAVQAKDDVKAACVLLGTKLQRCISSQLGPDWSGIFGEPF